MNNRLPTPEEIEAEGLMYDPDYRERQYRRNLAWCSPPVDLAHPERDFPILAKSLDEIGPVLAMRSEREELPF